MPDHLHILVEGAHDRCDLLEFIRLFKQRTAFQFRKSHRRALWESSYYDHVLRPGDQIEDIACYIWWNPVRKRLSTRPQEFPYSGSQTIALTGSAALGQQIASLLDSESPVQGVTAGDIRPGLRSIATTTRAGGGNLKESDLGVTAGWGHSGKGGITMPGK